MVQASRFNRKWFIIILLIILALVSRWYHLFFKSAFDDEFMLISTLSQPLKDLIYFCYSDVHPPLFRILLHFSIYFGEIWNESFVFFIRSISAVSGIFLIIPIWMFCDRYLNRGAAIVASLGIIFSTALIEVSQEARVYSLFCLVSMSSFYLMMAYENKPSRVNRILYGLVTLLGLYLNYWMVFVLLSQWILYVGWKWEKKGTWVYLQDILLVIGAYSPWFIAWFLHRLNEPAFQNKLLSFISFKPFLMKMYGINRRLFAGYESDYPYHRDILLFLVILIAGVGVYSLWKKNRTLCISMLSLIFIPQLTGFIKGFVLYSKYLSFIIPILLIFAAYGLSQWKIKYLIPLAALLILLQVPILHNYYQSEVNPYVKQDYRGLALYLKDNLQSNDHLISYGNHWIPNFYMKYPISHQHYPTPISGFPDEKILQDIDNPQFDRVWMTYLTYQEKEIQKNVFTYMHRDILHHQEFGKGMQLVLLGEMKSRENQKTSLEKGN